MAQSAARHDVDKTFGTARPQNGLDRVLALCARLHSYAARLDVLRAQDREDGSGRSAGRRSAGQGPESFGLWRGLAETGRAETGRQASSAPPRWYHPLDPIYAELDGIIAVASQPLTLDVLRHPRIAAVMPSLHGLRAAFEQDKEAALARALLAATDARDRLKALLAQEAYWAFSPEIRRALAGSRRVLVAGSGPLPLTGLGIAAGLGAQVTCLDRDPEAVELGERLIAVSDQAPRMRSLQGDVKELGDLGDYDAVVGAVLLGVDTKPQGSSRRTEIARHMILRMRPEARLVLRDPHGLGRLLYPALSESALRGFDLRRWVPTPGADPSYRVSVLRLRR